MSGTHHPPQRPSEPSSLADGYYDDGLFDDDDPHELQHHQSYHLPLRHAAHPQPPSDSLPPPPQQLSTSARKLASSLAQITVPPFSTFRSQVPRPNANAAFQHHPSPRAASFSLSEKASPWLADPSVRPLSLDSPLPPLHEVGSSSEPLLGDSSGTPARHDELQDR